MSMNKFFSKLGKFVRAGVSIMLIIVSLTNNAKAVDKFSFQNSTDINNAVGFLDVIGAVASFNSGDNLIFDGNNHQVIITAPLPLPNFINSIDFNNKTGVLGISGLLIPPNTPINLGCPFQSTGGNNGNIQVRNGANVIFNSTFSNVPGMLVNILDIDSVSFATFTKDLYLSGNVYITGAGVLNINGVNVTATDIIGLPAGPVNGGNVNFIGNSIVNSKIGQDGIIKQISIGSGTVTFNSGVLNADQMNLTNANSVAQFNAATIANLVVQNTSGTDGTGTIKINNNITFSKHIAATGARLNSIIFLSDSTLTYKSDTAAFIEAVDIYPNASVAGGKGSLLAQYDVDKNINNDIGKSDAKLKLVALSYNSAQSASQISTLKTGKKIYANKLDIYPHNLTGAGLVLSTTLNVETNTIIDALITTTPTGGFAGVNINTLGIVNILGSSTLTGGIGEVAQPMSEVNFKSLLQIDVVLFTGDIYAGTITQAQPNLTILQDNTVFYAKTTYTATNSTYSLGLNKLTIKGGTNALTGLVTGTNVMTGTAKFNLTANDNKAGSFIVDRIVVGGNVVNPMTSGIKNIYLTDATLTPPAAAGRSYIVFGAVAANGTTTALTDNDTVTFQVATYTNPIMATLVDWTYANGVITQKPKQNINNIIVATACNQLAGQVCNPNVGVIAHSNSGAKDDLIQAVIEDEGGVQQFVNGINPAIAEASENVFDAIQDLIGDVSIHLGQNSRNETNLIFVEDDGSTAIAAGDQYSKYGIWTNYSVSVNSQKAKGSSPGYKSKNNGITIGFDTLINDETTIGIAFGYIDTRVHHKDSNFGDKTIAKSSLVSLYSVTELFNNWYIQGQAIFGQSKINNLESRNTKAAQEIAKANYKVFSYGLALETGYHFLTKEKFVITPLMGLELDVIGKSKYQEAGTKNQNLSVKKGIDTKLIGSVGIAVAKNYNISGYNITPEVYGVIRHNFLNKNPKITARLPDVEIPLVVGTARNTRTFYNLGLGITHAMKTSQVTLGYDCYLGEKYLSHQGSIKLRLDF